MKYFCGTMIMLFHVLKFSILLMRDITSLSEYSERSLRGSSKFHDKKDNETLYFTYKYLLAHRSHQKKIGLRTYRIVRVFLKLCIDEVKWKSEDDRRQEYMCMLKDTSLW